MQFAARELSPAKFGAAWTDLIVAMARPRAVPTPRPAVDAAVRDRVIACPDRGPVLPISMQASCGCRGREVSECRRGLGTVPGRVTLRECLACKA
jgi:hypothetical protein